MSYDVELKRRNSDTDRPTDKTPSSAVSPLVNCANCLSVRATSVPRPRGYPMVTCGKGRPRTPSVRLPYCLALPASCRGKGGARHSTRAYLDVVPNRLDQTSLSADLDHTVGVQEELNRW